MAKIIHFQDLYDKKGELIERKKYYGSTAAYLHLDKNVDFVITVEAVELDCGRVHHVEKVIDYYTREQFDYDVAERKDFLKSIGFAGDSK